MFLVDQSLSQSSVHLAYKDEQNFTLKILVIFVSWCCWWLWKYVPTLTLALMKIPHLFKPDPSTVQDWSSKSHQMPTRRMEWPKARQGLLATILPAS